MQLIDIVNGAVWSVQATRSFRVQKNADGTYNFEGDSCGAQYVNASDIMILPDDVEVEVAEEINPDWYALEISLDHLLAPTAEGAQADALGQLMRSSISEGTISDEELLRVAPALEERKWQAGLPVKAGDVYSHMDALWVCVQGHLTLHDWPPDRVVALWRRVKAKTETPTAWMPQMDYVEDDVVFYPDRDGMAFRCKLAHTSLAGWEPPNTPALWETVRPEEGSL